MPRKKKTEPDPLETFIIFEGTEYEAVVEVRDSDTWEIDSGQHNALKCENRCDRVLEWVFEQYFIDGEGPITPKKDILKSRRALNEGMELSGLFEDINEQTVRKTIYPHLIKHFTALRNGFDQHIRK